MNKAWFYLLVHLLDERGWWPDNQEVLTEEERPRIPDKATTRRSAQKPSATQVLASLRSRKLSDTHFPKSAPFTIQYNAEDDQSLSFSHSPISGELGKKSNKYPGKVFERNSCFVITDYLRIKYMEASHYMNVRTSKKNKELWPKVSFYWKLII